MKRLSKKEQGFTLIEIVIVLAIAAAIMLMVFLAVAGARKSQRDTQRRADAARIASTLEQYSANNGGSTPPAASPMVVTAGTYFGDYINGKFTAPGGASYLPGNLTVAAVAATAPTAPALNTVAIALGTSNTYYVCIGAETTSQVCVNSK